MYKEEGTRSARWQYIGAKKAKKRTNRSNKARAQHAHPDSGSPIEVPHMRANTPIVFCPCSAHHFSASTSASYPNCTRLLALSAHWFALSRFGLPSSRPCYRWVHIQLHSFTSKKRSSGPAGRSMSFAQLASVLLVFLSSERTATTEVIPFIHRRLSHRVLGHSHLPLRVTKESL